MQQYYILGPTKNPIPVSQDKYLDWVQEFGMHSQMAADRVSRFFISTVFLGLNHDYNPPADNMTNIDYKPIVFETMVFTDKHEEVIAERYSTYQDAIAMHKKLVQHIRATGLAPESTDCLYDANADAGII